MRSFREVRRVSVVVGIFMIGLSSRGVSQDCFWCFGGGEWADCGEHAIFGGTWCAVANNHSWCVNPVDCGFGANTPVKSVFLVDGSVRYEFVQRFGVPTLGSEFVNRSCGGIVLSRSYSAVELAEQRRRSGHISI